MRREKRQLSQGSVDGHPRYPQRRRLSITQTNNDRPRVEQVYSLYSYDQQTHYQFIGSHHHHTSNAAPGLRAPTYRSDIGALTTFNPIEPRSDVLSQGQPFGPNAASPVHSYVASTAMQSLPVQGQPPPLFLDQRPQYQLGPGAGTLPTYPFDGSQHHLTSNAAPGLSAPMYLSDDAALTVFNHIDPPSDILSRGQPGGCQDGSSFGHAWASTVMENPPVQGQSLPMTQVNYNENQGDHYQSLNYDYRLQQNDNLGFNNAFVFDNSVISDVGAVLNGPVYPSHEARTLGTLTSGYSGTSSTSAATWTQEAMRGLPVPRHRSSVMQARDAEIEDRNGVTPHQHPQVVYNQRYSNAPIFNGPIYGPVQNSSQIITVDVLQFLYQHAAMGAVHESDERFPPPLCHPGTRDVVIGRVIGWYLDRNGEKKGIMWIHAPAGYGKTAVAGSVKERLDAMELGFTCPAGATFFFWRTSPERNSPARFIITLVYQLSQSIPELRPSIEFAIKSKPGIVKMALEDQLTELIVKPFRSLSNLDTMPNRLVIIDGIDECINSDRESRIERKYAEDQEVVQIRVLRLIHRLQSHHLPLSFLILSRPEAWIKRHFESEPYRDVVEALDLYEVGDHMNDVKRFVRVELSRIANSFGLEGVDEEWADEQALVRKSEGHMVYAATVIRHIDDEYADPRALLKGIVCSSSASTRSTSHSAPLSSLYELYRQIMRSCPERNQSLMREVLEDTIMTISDWGEYVCCQDGALEAVLRVLDGVSKRSPGDGLRALRPLHAVLCIGDSNEGTDIDSLFIHSSFREFLEDPQLSFESVVDLCKGRERWLSNVLDRLSSITTDTIGNKLEDTDVFALDHWSWLWKHTFPKSRETHIMLMKKIGALDLTTCVIQHYLSPNFGYTLCDDALEPLLNCSQLSEFFIQSGELEEDPDILPVVHMVTSHTQASLDHAFTLPLKSSTFPAFSADARACMAWDCAQYLYRVTFQPDWREHQLVQALAHPGPDGIDMLKKVVGHLYDYIVRDGDQEVRDLLEHIYGVMVQEKNPIVEVEDHPFCKFLEYKAGRDWELDGSDRVVE